MRLPAHRLHAILEAFAECLGPDVWKAGETSLFLHGSRVDDSKRGGDIDLLLVSRHVELLRQKKRSILVAISKRIGDCRIDLTIAPLAAEQQSDFVRSVLPGALQLFPF